MKIIKVCLMVASVVLLTFVSTANAKVPQTAQKPQLAQKKVMTLAVARQIEAAAEKAACPHPEKAKMTFVAPGEAECSASIAITDDNGNLIYLVTLDGCQAPSITMAIEKAKTAALYRRATSTFHDAVLKNTNPSYMDGSFPNMTTARNGVPLVVDGQVIGAIGVSGGITDENTATVDAAVKELAKIVGH